MTEWFGGYPNDLGNLHIGVNFLTEGSHDQQISRCYSNAVRRSWNFQMRPIENSPVTTLYESETGAYVVQYTQNIGITCISIGKRIIHHQFGSGLFWDKPTCRIERRAKTCNSPLPHQQGGFPFSTFSYILPIYGTPQAVARWIHPLKCQPEKDFRGRVRG